METVEIKESALQILDEREAGLIALADQYKDLKINGVEDKDGYRKVRQARIELKNARVGVENDAKALRENAVKFQKAVIAREKELVLVVLRTENSLKDQEETYNQALEAIKIEKEREEKARIQNRITALGKFNYALDLYEVTTMPDDKFNELLTQVEIDFNKEQERIAAEKAETERMRKEEAERLRLEREALAKQRAELEAAQRKADLELADRARQEREWIEEQNRKKAAIEADRQKFEEEKRQHAEALRLEQATKEAAERARIEEQERIKREAEEIAAALERDKREAIRQEALKPDKEKLYQYAKSIMAIPIPELSHKDAKTIIGVISERVVKTSEFIHDKAIAL